MDPLPQTPRHRPRRRHRRPHRPLHPRLLLALHQAPPLTEEIRCGAARAGVLRWCWGCAGRRAEKRENGEERRQWAERARGGWRATRAADGVGWPDVGAADGPCAAGGTCAGAGDVQEREHAVCIDGPASASVPRTVTHFQHRTAPHSVFLSRRFISIGPTRHGHGRDPLFCPFFCLHHGWDGMGWHSMAFLDKERVFRLLMGTWALAGN
jgi:hypothetical protein